MECRDALSREALLRRVATLEAQLAEANARLASLDHEPTGTIGPTPRMASASGDAPLGKGPLDGIKVLDFSQYQNGPTATMMLSDYGAEVMKVERPGGEAGRALGSRDKSGYYFSTYFQALNRGKKSCPLDMNKEGSKEVVKRMVQWCDVSTCGWSVCSLVRSALEKHAYEPTRSAVILRPKIRVRLTLS